MRQISLISSPPTHTDRHLQKLIRARLNSLVTPPQTRLPFNEQQHNYGLAHQEFIDIVPLSPMDGFELCINFSIHQTKNGELLVASADNTILMTAFMNQPDTQKARRLLVNHWPQAQILRAERPSHQIVQQLINKPTAKQTLQVYLSATPFQLNVWNQLLAIKCGQLTTYQAIADTLGTPNAARAVGQAVGHNPLAWLIPCHRVVRSDGQLGGFRWGMERKKKILVDELSA